MRIVFLTQRLPYPPNRGDRLRAYHEIRVLASAHEVNVLSLVHSHAETAQSGGLDGIAASVTTALVPRYRNLAAGAASWPTSRPLTHALLSSPSVRPLLRGIVKRVQPHLVVAFCSSMVRYALEEPLAGIPFLMDMVDVDSEKWAALARTTGPPLRWVYRREARLLAPFEAASTRKSLVTFVVNEREASSLRRLAGASARVQVLLNGIDLAYLSPPATPARSADVVFCGVMNYVPNVQGAVWMAREVWPRVRNARPEARLLLVGTGPTRRLLDLPRLDPSIVVTGTVPDVRPYLWNGAVAAAPLLVARGVQSKVLEAVGAGLPTVVTPAVAEGLPQEVMPACRVAASPEAFAQALIELLALGPEARRAIVAAADVRQLAWEQRLEPLVRAVEEIGRVRAV